MSLESEISALTAAVKENSAILTQVLAGQKTVIESLTSGGTEPGKGKGKAAAETGKTDTANADKGKGKGKGVANYADVISDLARNKFLNATDDTDERQERGAFIKSLAENFGVGKLTEISDGDEQKAAVWYLKRKIAGLDVNFSAENDFDSDPTAGGSSDDEDGI